MTEDAFQILQVKNNKNLNGDALLINTSKLKDSFDYLGLWYAMDGNQKTFITTEIYYSNGSCEKPQNFNTEIKENSFKQNNRYKLPFDKKWIWISTRIDNSNYCSLAMKDSKQGKLLINYKIIHNKFFGFKVLGKGILKGGSSCFFRLGSEDCTGKINYKDAVIFVVLIKDYPPEDWGITDNYINIENMPILSSQLKLAHNKRYSDWFDQNPLDCIK